MWLTAAGPTQAAAGVFFEPRGVLPPTRRRKEAKKTRARAGDPSGGEQRCWWRLASQLAVADFGGGSGDEDAGWKASSPLACEKGARKKM